MDQVKYFQAVAKRETQFTSQSPANEIMSKIEETAKPMGFNIKKRDYKVTIYLQLVKDIFVSEMSFARTLVMRYDITADEAAR